MAQSDIETFLQDLLLRYDPNIDLSDGGRAQVQLVQPILGRIGTDPFDTDIATFVMERLTQAFPNLSLTQTTALRDGLVNPMRVLLEPIVREIKLVKLRQSIANVERLSDDEVDALMANFFEERKAGGYSRGVVRVYFTSPVTVSFTLIQVASTRDGLRYIPSPAQTITKDQMLLNREGQEYYVDVTYVAEKRGDEYNVDRNEVVAISNLASASRIRNPNRFSDGLPRENSVEFVSRTEAKLSDRTLTVSRGILSELTDNFSGIRRVQVVGFKDPEMLRDIVKGGGLGPIRPDDVFGVPYGDAVAVDDGDGNATTRRISTSGGHFISRIGSAGTDPAGFYITLVYFDPFAVFVDAAVLEVISDTDVLIDFEIPAFPLAVHWALRRRELTLSDIPGGVTLPDTIDGELVIHSDEVHIGGKTDIYLAGDTVVETAAITGISDEEPLAAGGNAQTTATSDVVTINDPPGSASALAALLEEGFFSLVLEEGADAGSYDIRSVTVAGPTVQLRVQADMSGTVSNLLWKIVDNITIELTEPKDIKLTGVDLTVVAGNPSVTTLSSVNFVDANVQQNDTLRIDADEVGGDYTITAVGVVSITVAPPPPVTASNLSYTIFRPTGAVAAPVVRVTSVELLDSGGAPNGVRIPYRDPVAVVTRGFQNEGSGLEFEGYSISIGLVSGAFTGSLAFGAGRDLDFVFYDQDKVYAGNTSAPLSPSGLITLTLTGTLNAAAIVAAVAANPALVERKVTATEITYDGYSYIGFYCPELVVLDTGGTANTLLGFPTTGRPASNADVRLPSSYNPRRGDLLEFVGGNNIGGARVLADKVAPDTRVMVGDGPTDELIYDFPIHQVSVLRPEVGVRMRGGRPSIGSARAYFLAPTSAEFRYGSTAFSVLVGTSILRFRPDPENDRVIQPAPPLTDLPREGTCSFGAVSTVFSDTTVDFQALNIRPGDLLDVLYQPLRSSAALPTPATLAVTGLTLILRLAEEPWITITFPLAMTREDLVDYINEQVGEDIAALGSAPYAGHLILEAASKLITIREDSTVLISDVLLLGATGSGAPRSTAHTYAGTYVIAAVNETSLQLSTLTPLPSATAVGDTAYRIRRHVQRISSTEMDVNVDATGLYYVDVEMLSLTPGDTNNAPPELSMTVTGVVSDGYRLYAENDTLTYSRAEKLYAEVSRSMLLVGSSDSPEEYVQLSRQNIQVSYDRSQIVDDVQSFADSDAHRVVNEEILVRHLLPHYVNLAWRYVGGELETVMRPALSTAIEEVEADEELEVLDLTRVMTARGVTSIYSSSSEAPSGRTAPVMVVVHHDVSRRIRAEIVKDYVKTSRTQRFIADDLAIVRVAPGGLR